MKRLVPLVLIAAIVTACNGKHDPGGPSGSARPGGGGQVIPAPTEDNIGDLEQAALISVAVAQKSQGPNVEATPLVDASGRMNLFTVDIAPPLPNGIRDARAHDAVDTARAVVERKEVVTWSASAPSRASCSGPRTIAA